MIGGAQTSTPLSRRCYSLRNIRSSKLLSNVYLTPAVCSQTLLRRTRPSSLAATSENEEDEERRQVTLADGSPTSSLGSFNCNIMLRHKSHGTFSLHSICFHILTNLAFNMITGYPCIWKYSLMSRFPSLLSETCLQVHNCTKYRQCLPERFQQDRAPKDGEACSEVLLAVPCAGTLVKQRVPYLPRPWWSSGE